MKTLLALTGILAMLALSACGQKDAGQAEEAASHADAGENQVPAAGDGPGHDATLAAVTLTGTLGCGHCTFHQTDGCSAAMKTADGTIYILDGVDEHSEAYQQRMNETGVSVVGVIAEGDPPHVKVTSLEL